VDLGDRRGGKQHAGQVLYLHEGYRKLPEEKRLFNFKENIIRFIMGRQY